MKRTVTLILALTAALCLTAAARADVIAGPVEVALGLAQLLGPVLLVAAVVVVTLLLLRSFRNKK